MAGQDSDQPTIKALWTFLEQQRARLEEQSIRIANLEAASTSQRTLEEHFENTVTIPDRHHWPDWHLSRAGMLKRAATGAVATVGAGALLGLNRDTALATGNEGQTAFASSTSSPTVSVNNSGTGAGLVSTTNSGTGVVGTGGTGMLANGKAIGIQASAVSSSTGVGVKATGGSAGFGVQASGDVGVEGTGIVGVVGTGSGTGMEASGKSLGITAFSTGASTGVGVYCAGGSAGTGVVASAGRIGVEAIADSTSAGVGVAAYGGSAGSGVVGHAGSGGTGVSGYGNIGVRGNGSSTNGAGVVGIGAYGISGQGSSVGVYAHHSSGTIGTDAYLSTGALAADLYGNVQVHGSLTKSSGSFQIDHPLDPAHRYLLHSFVESPDMMNVYNGLVTLDLKGEALVTLPDWFEALNMEFRYQLTPIGSPAALYIAHEIEHNRFKIAGGTAGMRVSWQVTGIRQDAWANAHRIPVEEDKPAAERGHYLHPELHGAPPEKGVQTVRHQMPSSTGHVVEHLARRAPAERFDRRVGSRPQTGGESD